MYNPLWVSMDGVNCRRQVVQIALRLGKGKRLLWLEQILQRSSGYQRHDQVEQRAILPEIQHRHNVFMLELMSITCLAAKTLNRGDFIDVATAGLNDLEGHLLHLKGIAGPVDRAHAAQAQKRLNAITASDNRVRQQALAVWFHTFESSWRVVSATPRIGTTRHSSSSLPAKTRGEIHEISVVVL